MTTHPRRLVTFLGALGAVALALTLVADATAAQASAQRAQKQRRARPAPDGQEREAQPPAWPAQPPAALDQWSAWLVRERAAQQPPAVAAGAAGTAAATLGTTPADRTGTVVIVRGARRGGILPKVVPPFPGPASPIR